MTVALAPAVAPRLDPRFAAFIAADGPEVFSGVVYANQIWKPDPFDVDAIHHEARDAFGRLLNRAAGSEPPPHGKTLLLLGEAGSGKTHLMRAFRMATHTDGRGYCGYLQMNTRTYNYARYVLSKLIDALEQPYQPNAPATGLTRLARGLFDALPGASELDRRRFLEEVHEPADVIPLVERFADAAMVDPRFIGLDLDVIRALLYLLPGDGRIRARVLKWLRCEDLGRYDREMLGDLVPRPQEEMPLRTIVGLGRLMAVIHQAALVLCVDQLEEMIRQSDAEEKPGELFRRAVEVLLAVIEEVPRAVVVVACLEDFYTKAKDFLTKPKFDRLRQEPEIRLSSHRGVEDISSLIAKRLEGLYEEGGAKVDPVNPLFPYNAGHIQKLAGMRIRDVLDFIRQHHEECVRAGRWINPTFHASGDKTKEGDNDKERVKPLPMEQSWNDFLASFQAPSLEDENELADLLAWSVKTTSAEMPDGFHFETEANGRMAPVEAHGPGNDVEKLLVAVCDKSARGGGLSKQVEETARKAGENPAVIVRSTPFPKTPNAVVSKLIASLCVPIGRGRRVEVQNADWRAMAAFRRFQEKEHGRAEFGAWQKQGQPLSNLPAIRAILDLDRLLTRRPAAAPVAPPRPAGAPKVIAPPVPLPLTPESGTLLLGNMRGMIPSAVTVVPQELTYHAAFLGGSGSGKTTAALNLIEQLLMRGVPAVLVDRKGDLCRYADPAAWEEPTDPSRVERRRALRDRIDVALFTPGAAAGRPLALPIVPTGLGQLPEADREQLAGFAAAALVGMLGYKLKGPDAKLAILSKAIEVLALQPGRDVTVEALRRLVEDRDEALVLAVDGFDAKHYKKLGEDLHSLAMGRRQLLAAAAEPLEIDALLGRGSDAIPGKTRLSIVNTQFLGDPAAIEFWVAQLLLALDRWRTKNPSPQLQAVFLFDEADAYLPAIRQPATKAPMESLLRRARSAGVGLFLATQSPGDLDYKCRDQIRTWLIGRVKEQVAITKLKPILEAGRVDAAAKLPGQGTGQFYLVREREVVAVQSEPSLVPTVQLPEDQILELARSARRVDR
jgi:Cdc6-like AAA superfamily ATPase